MRNRRQPRPLRTLDWADKSKCLDGPAIEEGDPGKKSEGTIRKPGMATIVSVIARLGLDLPLDWDDSLKQLAAIKIGFLTGCSNASCRK